MQEPRDLMQSLVRFSTAFLLAIVSVVVTVLIFAQIWSLVVAPGKWVWEEYPAGAFVIVGIAAAVIGVVPAALTFLKKQRLVSSAAIGCLTGSFASSLVIVLSTNLDPASSLMWRSALERAHFIPLFGFAGLVGGAVFHLASVVRADV